ncbi:MAG: hypothetical protein CO156_02420 [Candidatus Pacebacteria bacterium CG_4_9_14_3_um_filter_40_12]|nr:MAG: hypothetical protein COU64_04950 [Candidatus Pacebacteria bacterium CG10_big_fil_rev_8_21_14_0_10_40_26]PIZ79143.1 MAG: hypothetical protein COY01_01815 [Candidatus Pacebacteria bacterium CG_4_10_14_0_2_um_filter_40_20]PJA68798.1 MAG: hypothetical protein CO156_02420 [Candidatus Pacebacteria bacterium CG_4_9_14_3_um_filter_40_12]PJC42109.1 MAG: hypothetical protein CO041_00525 [Candidatus Pacebacteria bacterium CG_4_9_14_0_2_um_filter_40_15]
MSLFLVYVMLVHEMLHTKLASSEPKKWLLLAVIITAIALTINSAYTSNQELVTPDPEEIFQEVEPAVAVPPQEVPKSQEVTLVFGGDLQFDRFIRQRAAVMGGYDKLFEGFETLSQSADGFVANLEGPITDFDSISSGSAVGSSNNYIFTFSPEVVPVLKDLGFVLLNLGNNHILNFGAEGLAQTRATLNQAGLAHWGSVGGDSWLDDSFVEYEKNGMKFLFVNYNQFLWGDVDELLAELTRRKAALQPDFVVVYTHWGTEYQPIASEYYRALAGQFVAAGADIIIGSHPHVVQQHESINGVPVYYSLGNFVFDQYFEENVRRGLLLKVTFKKGSPITIEEQPIYLEGTGKTVLISPK